MTATGAIKSPLLLARGKTIALDSLSTLTRRQRDRKVKSGDTDAKQKNEWKYKKEQSPSFLSQFAFAPFPVGGREEGDCAMMMMTDKAFCN